MSFVWDSLSWLVQALLQSLGLAGKSGNLLVLGLDNAGKTTLLYSLHNNGQHDNAVRSFPPTDRPSFINEFHYGSGLKFNAWDLGGHEAVRHLWEDYVSDQVSAVLFLIDAADHDRLEEAAYELDALLSPESGALSANNVPVAILLNKCDMDIAMSTEEVCGRIEYDRLKAEHNDCIDVFRISVLRREGYGPAFKWVGGFLK
jgi:GTP-binding protein SAR1